MPAERGIGLLKGRFRRLMYYIDMKSITDIIECILSACALHEICLLSDSCQDIDEMIQEGRTTGEVIAVPVAEHCERGTMRREQIVEEVQRLHAARQHGRED